MYNEKQRRYRHKNTEGQEENEFARLYLCVIRSALIKFIELVLSQLAVRFELVLLSSQAAFCHES
jgi:hypothetical protein